MVDSPARTHLASRIALSVTLALAVVAVVDVSPTTAQPRSCRPIHSTTTTDLGTLGGAETFGSDIDDRGRVVGRSQTPSGLFHAFRWVRGVMTDLTPSLPGPSSAVAANERGQILLERSDPATGTPAALWWRGRTIDITGGYPLDLNERGQVLLNPSALWDHGATRPIEAPAGSGLIAIAVGLGDGGHVYGSLLPVPVPGGGHPGPVGWFVWLDGTLTQIDVAPYQVREVVDIDARGRALVNASDATGRSRALLWDGVGYVDLGSLTPDGNTWAADMNNRGQVVGASATASGDHAFLWQDGQMTDLHTLGDGYSHAIAVSSRGHVAGALTPMAGRGFLWWCGVMIDLMTPGVYVNQPIDVNAHGQVISAIDSLSGSRVVLSTPTGR